MFEELDLKIGEPTGKPTPTPPPRTLPPECKCTTTQKTNITGCTEACTSSFV